MNGNYFEDLKNQSGKNKILLVIIAALLIINLIMFKSLINIASNKTVQFQVPGFLESGEYVIGSTFANENVFKMWSKVWITELANFSYKDVRERVGHIIEFLAPETTYKNKAELLEFIDFVEENFITQSFSPDNFEIKELNKKGFYSVSWTGIIKREIGMKNDPLSNIEYKYEFTCFVRNGQIYIHSLKTDVANPNDVALAKKVNDNEFINYDLKIKTRNEIRQEKKELRQKEGDK